jgi:hypothetical protein
MADKLIVVDVQPDFEPYITFDIKDFVDYLLEFDGEILYIYDSVNGTTENDVIN